MKEFKEIQNLKRFLYRFEDLKKLSKKIRSLDIKDCNEGLKESQIKRRAKLMFEARQIAKEFNLDVYHQGDPRGCTLYLIEELQPLNEYLSGIPIL